MVWSPLGCGPGGGSTPPDGSDTPLPSDTDVTDPGDTDIVNPPDTGPDGTGVDTVDIPPESNCDDGLDDNNDGLTDCDDPSCVLTTTCSPTCSPTAALVCGENQAGQNDGEGSTQVFASYGCNDYLYTGPEVAYSISVEKPTYVTVTLEDESDNTDVLVLNSQDGGCFSESCIASGLKDAVFLAQANTSYFVVVDGYEGAIGNYTLNTHCEECVPNCSGKVCGDDGCGGSCGECQPGETCQLGQAACVVVPSESTCGGAVTVSVPYFDFGDTTDAFDSYGALGLGCEPAGASGGHDVVYTLTPTSTDIFRIRLEELIFDAVIYIVSDCGDMDSSCVTGLDAPDEESLEVGLQAGTTYFIVVDGTDELQYGSFALNIESLGPCTPNCDGCNQPDGCGGMCPCDPVTNDTCDMAQNIDPSTLPVSIQGNTVTAKDNYQVELGECPDQPGWSLGQDSSDVVFHFQPSSTGAYTFDLGSPTDTAFDSSLYILGDCSEVAASCVGADEIVGLGGEKLSVALTAGTPYFVVVDGYSESQGAFTLHVSQCVPQCGQSTCGSDGCGGSCGSCTGSDYCFDGACKALGCGEVTTKGCCIDDSLVFCLSDKLVKVNCTATDGSDDVGTCGWNPQDQWYDCGQDGADPTGEIALQCPAL